MKSAVLLAAVLSGLCAEAMGSPIGNIDRENPAAPFIEPDLNFYAESPDEAFPEQDLRQLVTTDFDQGIDEDPFALEGSEISGSFGVPEPPPVILILGGLSFFGIFALWSRRRRERRRIRRCVVRMREIMAER